MSGICGVLGPGGTLGEVGRLGESGGIPALWGYLRDPGLGVLGSPGVRSGGPRDLRGLWRVLLRSGIPWMCWRVPRSPPGNGPPPPPRSGTWCVPHVGRYPWSKPRTCWAGHWAAWLRAWPATGSGAGGAGGVSPHRAPSPAQPPTPQVWPPSHLPGVPGAGGAAGAQCGAGHRLCHGVGGTAALRGCAGRSLPLPLRGA